MRWKSVLTIAAMVGGVSYGALSAYVVTASLKPTGVCSPSGGPPPDLNPEAVRFNSRADGTELAGWLLPSATERAVVLIHGIDSDAWSGAAADLARAYRGVGFDVLLFDQRAHGRSGGTRITLGHLERGDISAAIKVLLERGLPPGRIALHGTSYGAAMALLAAAEMPEVGALVADSAFADVRDLMATEVARRTHVPGVVAGIMRPGIEAAAQLLFGLDLAQLAPELAASRIAPRPLLLVHGSADRIIPVDHARRLSDQAADESTQLWILKDSGHTEGARSGPCNRTPSPSREVFLDRVVSFVRTALD